MRLFLTLMMLVASAGYAADSPFNRSTSVNARAVGSAGTSGTVSLQATQVGYGSGANTLTGDSTFTYTGGLLQVTSVSSTNISATVGNIGRVSLPATGATTINAGGLVVTGNNILLSSGFGIGVSTNLFFTNNSAGFGDVTPNYNFDVSGTLGTDGNVAIGLNDVVASSTLHVSGTSILGLCNASITCGASQAGAVCYGASRRTLYACRGDASWIPYTSATAVSASGSM